jgi:hypothetical protein
LEEFGHRNIIEYEQLAVILYLVNVPFHSHVAVVGSDGPGLLGFTEASGGYDDHPLRTFDDFVAEDVVGVY